MTDTVLPAPAVLTWSGDPVRARRNRVAFAGNLVAILGAVMALYAVAEDERVLAMPMLALAELAFLHLTVLWARDGQLPLFEVGTLWVLATCVYGIFAMLGFILMHGVWDQQSDWRLQQYPFVGSRLAKLGWECFVYAASFVAIYLPIRGRAVITREFVPPRATTVFAVLTLYAIVYGTRLALNLMYGFDADSVSRMPYMVQQLSHNVVNAVIVVEQAVLTILISRWRSRTARILVVVWLVQAIASAAVRLDSRTEIVLMLLTAGILYHRFVKPISLFVFGAATTVLLAAFLAAGALRPTGPARTDNSVTRTLTRTNEFQAIFSTAFDLEQKRDAGLLPPVPWQIYVVDAYLPVPSQFLPFDKIEPSTWYADSIGQGESKVGFMFGVLAQAAVGFGWLELIFRGLVLAVVFAALHRWYAHRSTSFWITQFYLFVGVWTYYTFRATSFWFVYFILYQFLPVMIVAWLLEVALDWLLSPLPAQVGNGANP